MKITFIGDSIREQYAPRVAELLGEGYEIWQPSENCRFAKYIYRGLFDWTRYMSGSDIIHFNAGLWDMCNLFGDGPFSTEEEYVRDMLRVADMLKRRYNAVLVFATTTPAERTNKFYDDGIVDRFNSLIVPKLEEMGVIINDLNSLVSEDTDRYIRDDGVHLSPEGIEVSARRTAELIRSLGERIGEGDDRAPSPSDDDTTGAPVLI